MIAVTKNHGFDIPAEKGVTRDITRTPGANEREGAWSPNGKQIAYISDRTGETEIWLQSVEGGEMCIRDRLIPARIAKLINNLFIYSY